MMNRMIRCIPLLILLLGLITFLAFNGQQYLDLNWLSNQSLWLDRYVNQHFLYSSLLFVLIYMVSVAFSFPGAAILTLVGGFLFGVWIGTLWTIIAATLGAVITYFSVRCAFGNLLQKMVSGRLHSLQQGFSQNEFNYLLTLRLLPIVPFFIINIASGVVGVKMRTFVITSLIGMAPCALVYAWMGSSLGSILSRQEGDFSAYLLLSPEVILPLSAIGLLSLLPIIVKKIIQQKEK